MHFSKKQGTQIRYSKIFLLSLAFMMVILNSFIVEGALNDSLTAYYKFSETSGNTANNSVSNIIYKLNVSGTSALGTRLGKFDYALNISNSVTNFAENLSVRTGNISESICFWTNISTIDTNDVLFAHYTPTASNNSFLYFSGASTLTLDNNFGVSNATSITYTSYLNAVTFICAISNTSSTALWINGVMVNSTARNQQSYGNLINLTIGNDRAGLRTRAINGWIDEFSLFNRSLTSTEISQLYNSGAGNQYPFLGTSTTLTNLTSPSNGTVTANKTINFVWNVTISNSTLSNSTLYIWNSSGSLVTTSSTNGMCYQETANASNSNDGNCNLNYSGSYRAFLNNGTEIFADSYYQYFDANWNTYATGGIQLNRYRYYTNYSFPSSIVQSAIWQVKNNAGTTNLTINQNCLNNNRLVLLSQKSSCFGTCSYGDYITYSCFGNDSTEYTLLSDSLGEVYEEAIIWNTSLNSKQLTLPYNSYLWNVFSYDTSLNSWWASSNYSFTIDPFIVSSITYNSSDYETSRQQFKINFTTDNLLYALGDFYYNSAKYPTTITCSNNFCTAISSLDIPTITAPISQNYSFYWNLRIYNGSSVETRNTSTYQQNISRILFSYCGSGNRTINFTAYDEQNATRINPFSFDGSFNVYLGLGTTFRNVNYTNTSATEVNFCINPSIQTYYTDAIIAYSAPASGTSYVTRNYFFQRHYLNNQTQNISLNLLKSASSTSFILKVTDQYASPLSNVLVEAIKCYPGTNTETIAFISRTDSNGLSVGNFEAETALYKFNITNNSQSLLYVDSCSKVVPQSTPYTLSFQVGTGYTSAFQNIGQASNLTTTLYYNASSRTIKLTYSDVSGQFNGVILNVRDLNSSGNTNPIVCQQSLNISAGELTCSVTEAGTFYAEAVVNREDGSFSDYTTFSVKDVPSIVGLYGVYIGWFIILVCAFMFKFNEIAGIWLVNVAIIFNDLVGLIDFGITFITSSLLLAIILTVVLER